jgi:hypothetical protein
MATPQNRPQRPFGWAFTPAFLLRTSRPFPCRLVPCGTYPNTRPRGSGFSTSGVAQSYFSPRKITLRYASGIELILK